MMASRERGRPARTKPGTASAISPTWINRERRHGSPSAWPPAGWLFPQKGWLPAAQRRPQGQHAGGTPALPGKAGPALPCGSFEGKRLIVNEDEPPMDTNKKETRIDTKTDGPASTARSAQKGSPWERGRPARTMMASRERGRPARTMPGTASGAIFPGRPARTKPWPSINRERRHGSPSAWPMLFPPSGWLPAASH